MNHNKESPHKDEKTALIFKYVSLVIQKRREKKINGELEEIRKKLNLSHKEIIVAAANMTTN